MKAHQANQVSMVHLEIGEEMDSLAHLASKVPQVFRDPQVVQDHKEGQEIEDLRVHLGSVEHQDLKELMVRPTGRKAQKVHSQLKVDVTFFTSTIVTLLTLEQFFNQCITG